MRIFIEMCMFENKDDTYTCSTVATHFESSRILIKGKVGIYTNQIYSHLFKGIKLIF